MSDKMISARDGSVIVRGDIEGAHANHTPRYLTFKAPTPLKVNQVVTVRDKSVVVRGRVVSSDWKGNTRIDTQIGG